MALPWVNVLVLVMLVLVDTYVGWDPILAAFLAAPCVLINAVLVVVWCYLRSEVRVPLVRKLQQAASSRRAVAGLGHARFGGARSNAGRHPKMVLAFLSGVPRLGPVDRGVLVHQEQGVRTEFFCFL